MAIRAMCKYFTLLTSPQHLSVALTAFTTKQEKKCRQIIPPASLIALPILAMSVPLPYPGEGEPLYGDPPISVTDQLPRPLGKKLPPLTQWYDICSITDERFQDLLKSVKATPQEELMHKMIVAFKHVKAEHKLNNPKQDCFAISDSTPDDIDPTLQSWLHNSEGVPTAICKEADGKPQPARY